MHSGLVEYIVLAFPGNNFAGQIAPALADLVRSGTIRVLDLVFVTKGPSGDVTTLEYDDLEEFLPFDEIDGEVGGLIGLDDIEYIGEGLDEGSSVALLIFEDLWAAPFVESLRAAGGVLIEGARIPRDLIDPALLGLAASI